MKRKIIGLKLEKQNLGHLQIAFIKKMLKANLKLFFLIAFIFMLSI